MCEEEDCGICGISLNDKYFHQMSCNHKFHYECLIKTFSNNSKNSKNNCPYCRSEIGHLPIVNGLKKVIMGIHTDSILHLNYLNELVKSKNSKCKYTLSRGKNKGNECGKNCALGYGYCKIHLLAMKKKHGNLIQDYSLSLPSNNENSSNV